LKNSEVINSRVCLSSGDYYYSELTITSTGILTCLKWDGKSGGKLLLRVKKLVIQKGGIIDLNGVGYRGGKHNQKKAYPDASYQGESYCGQGILSLSNNQGGGGGGNTSPNYGSIAGGGGGYGTSGEHAKPNGNNPGGQGGCVYGKEDLTEIYLGSGGGGGTLYFHYNAKPDGGSGGGVLVIDVNDFECYGTITVNGANGTDGTESYSSGGGGGSGGSIFINCASTFINKGIITAEGGKGGRCNCVTQAEIASVGGKGGFGRIRIRTTRTDFDYGSIIPSPFLKMSPIPSKIF